MQAPQAWIFFSFHLGHFVELFTWKPFAGFFMCICFYVSLLQAWIFFFFISHCAVIHVEAFWASSCISVYVNPSGLDFSFLFISALRAVILHVEAL